MYHFKGSFNSYLYSKIEGNKSKKRIYFILSKPFLHIKSKPKSIIWILNHDVCFLFFRQNFSKKYNIKPLTNGNDSFYLLF